MLTESLILSQFDYALSVWGPPLQRCLQHLQNRAIRVTKSLRKYDHVSTHRNNLNWLPISHQIKFRNGYPFLIKLNSEAYMLCSVIIIRTQGVCCWIHPSNLVGSTLTKHVAVRTLQVLLCVVLLVLKDIFVLLPAPGGILCLRIFMITI